jgi:hypothetical protein
MENKNISEPDFAAMRQKTLSQLEKAERAKIYAIIVIALLEIVIVAAFVWFADFSNRVHLLIFIAMLGIWLLVGTSLAVLGIFQRENMLRILNAIESLKD